VDHIKLPEARVQRAGVSLQEGDFRSVFGGPSHLSHMRFHPLALELVENGSATWDSIRWPSN
jgi:hypothetical protein